MPTNSFLTAMVRLAHNAAIHTSTHQVTVLPVEVKLWRIFLLICCSFNGACTTISYYAQSISGQVEILVKQRPISEVILDDATGPDLKQKLIEIEAIVDYAHQHLGLPDNGSYRKYADLQRRFVVWNVFAAPELSLQPKEWCYLVIGCATYRGYFSEEAAENYAESLQATGWEVYVGGVSAYSTLGWFRDPVMNTMLYRDTREVARLIFHELAHQRLYFINDTEFNEAFADTVALIGLQMWLQNQPQALIDSVNLQLDHEQNFIDLALSARTSLAEVYDTQLPDRDKRSRKINILEALKLDYFSQSSKMGGANQYGGWIDRANNASLSVLSSYRTLVPDLMNAYRNSGSSLDGFYGRIEKLANCSSEQRLIELRKTGESTAC